MLSNARRAFLSGLAHKAAGQLPSSVKAHASGGNRSTVFAVASGGGKAGVAVIRISGDKARSTLQKLLCAKVAQAAEVGEAAKAAEIKPRYANLRKLYSPKTHEFLDEALVLYFKGPHSFTGEDVVELHVHGGVANLNKFYQVLGETGCRLAGPGEFTQRGFLNGKLDLPKIEGLLDLINAETEAQRKLASQLYSGKLAEKVQAHRKQMVRNLAYLESVIDFSEHDEYLDESSQSRLHEDPSFQQVRMGNLGLVRELLAFVAAQRRRGYQIKKGLDVTIFGEPNVGKSSLMNILSHDESVSIVTPIAGTTRDVVSRSLQMCGYKVNLQDTAGIRDPNALLNNGADLIEKIGIRRSLASIEAAPLVLLVLDIAKATDPRLSIADLFNVDDRDDVGEPESHCKMSLSGKKVVVVVNKVDLLSSHPELSDVLNELAQTVKTQLVSDLGLAPEDFVALCPVSCQTSQGISAFVDVLSETVSAYFDERSAYVQDDFTFIAHERHEYLLLECIEQLLMFEERLTIACLPMTNASGDLVAAVSEKQWGDVHRPMPEIFFSGQSSAQPSPRLAPTPLLEILTDLVRLCRGSSRFSEYACVFEYQLLKHLCETHPAQFPEPLMNDNLARLAEVCITWPDKKPMQKILIRPGAVVQYMDEALYPSDVDLYLLADHLREAARALGGISGSIVTDDILDVLFRDFCIGK